MNGYWERRSVEEQNLDLIGFYRIGKHFENIYFGYLTDEKCSWKKSERLNPAVELAE